MALIKVLGLENVLVKILENALAMGQEKIMENALEMVLEKFQVRSKAKFLVKDLGFFLVF